MVEIINADKWKVPMTACLYRVEHYKNNTQLCVHKNGDNECKFQTCPLRKVLK